MNLLPFIPGQVYQRKLIHKDFGGNPQGGISPCKRFPYIFIFSNKQGALHGYVDRWVNENVYSYTGQGQVGDMAFVRGNLALVNHVADGRRVFFFKEVRSGFWQFQDEMEFDEFGYFESLDTDKKNRLAIKFFLKRKGAILKRDSQESSATSSFSKDSLQKIDYANKIVTTEKLGLVTSRVGQGAYRKSIIHRWEYACAVTGFTKKEILIASHILPWKDSSHLERLDVDNGILLSPTYDALFDRHLISFDGNGKIILSNNFDKEAYDKIGVDGKEKITKFSAENIKYLEKHQITFFNKEKGVF